MDPKLMLTAWKASYTSYVHNFPPPYANISQHSIIYSYLYTTHTHSCTYPHTHMVCIFLVGQKFPNVTKDMAVDHNTHWGRELLKGSYYEFNLSKNKILEKSRAYGVTVDIVNTPSPN